MTEKKPVRPECEAVRLPDKPRLRASAILAGSREAIIEHAGEEYRSQPARDGQARRRRGNPPSEEKLLAAASSRAPRATVPAPIGPAGGAPMPLPDQRAWLDRVRPEDCS